VYDLILIAFILVYLTSFVGLGIVLFPSPEDISLPILLIRAFGTCAIILLHLILAIGPLARISSKFNPLLYNRRHLGVTFFFVGLAHALVVFLFYGGFGVENPISAILTGSYRSGGVPYEFFGFLSLLIFAVMAATSHDFWLANLGPGFWKSMHMGVYFAYVLVIAHVVFGVLKSESNLLYPVMISAGVVSIASLHLITGLREFRRDFRFEISSKHSPWVEVCTVDEIEPNRAKIVQIDTDERIAIFKDGCTLSAVSNVCAHQNGPLGEGKIVNGCVTCPWHGYQYNASNGQSPPPFTEKIPTYDIRIEGNRVMINPNANEPGTPVKPAEFNPIFNAKPSVYDDG